jgi:hypothetical protein
MYIAVCLPIIHQPVRSKFTGELRAVLRRDLPQQYLDLIHKMLAELLRGLRLGPCHDQHVPFALVDGRDVRAEGLDQLVAVAGSITGDQGTAAERHLQDTRGGFADMDLDISVEMVF